MEAQHMLRVKNVSLDDSADVNKCLKLYYLLQFTRAQLFLSYMQIDRSIIGRKY